MAFENWTDEEVKTFALTGQAPAGRGAEGNEARRAQIAKKVAEAEALEKAQKGDPSLGMTGGELFSAGVGKVPANLIQGVSELAEMATLPSDPASRKAILERMDSERADRKRIEAQLMKNPAAVGGNIVGEGITAMAGPARLPAQVAMQGGMGFLNAPSKGQSGLTGELANRVVGGIEKAAPTAAIGVPLQGMGNVMGAVRGQYSPKGQAAMDLNTSAQRIGVNPSLRDLDPSSELAGFEGQLFGRAKTVEDQIASFNQAAQKTKPIPSATGNSTTDRLLEGEKLREGVSDAAQNLKTTGSKMWADVDAFIGQRQITPVVPQLSFQKAENILQRYTPQTKGVYDFEANPIINRIAYYNEDAAKKLVAMGRAPASAVKFGAPFQDLHEIQSAVGKAFGKAKRDAATPGAGEDAQKAFRELRELYSNISQDVDDWIKAVGSKDPELGPMVYKARDFWRDAVVPGTGGRLVAKANKGTWRQDSRGYAEPREFYSDLGKSTTQIEELLPYMNQEQQDLIRTFMGMSDMRQALSSGKAHPPTTGAGMLTNVGGMMLGSPLQLMKGALGHTPFVKDLASSNLGKRLYFAENSLENSGLGRIANALSAKPRWDLQEWTKERLGRN